MAVKARARGDATRRRAQILEEAIRIIGRRGYRGFSIQELAHRCGLTNAGLLYHFGSKDQLLIAVLQDRDRRDTEVVASVAGLPASAGGVALPLATIVDLLHAIVARNATQPEMVRLYAILQSEALDKTHPAYDYFLAREAATLGAITRLVAPHVEDARSTARQLLALMMGLEQQWLRADRAFDLAAEWDSAVRLLGLQRRPKD